jgi:glycerate dehydrogenase
MARGAWQQSEHFCMLDFRSRELQNRTLGIVGVGTLGRAVANVAAAFGMQVIAAELPGRTSEHSMIRRVPWDTFLAKADIISLHCPLTDATANLIDAKALDKMRFDALLINTARGGLVDSEALMLALKNGELGGAGIDVLPVEPPVAGDPLLSSRLPNLLITPHIAWASVEARQRAVDEIVACIRAFKLGEPINKLS